VSASPASWLSPALWEQLVRLPGLLTAHLQLSLAALGIGTVVSVPLGILLTRRPRAESSVLGLVGVIQTIPGLALLAVMVPALAALAPLARALGVELNSIGPLPAVIALSLYSMLPILRNTVTGIAGVEPALLEAARGVGMTPGQRLRRVELPLAMPVIVAGLRTAVVWVVGTATLSTPVGARSLGNFIFSGLQMRNQVAVLVGCAAAAALAVVLDQVVRFLERGLRTRRRVLTAAALLVLAVLYSWAAAALVWEREREPPIRIGSKTFTEQYILAEVLAQRIHGATGRSCQVLSSLGSTVLFDALRSGQIDLYVDYSGTIWATLLGGRGTSPGREAVQAQVARDLRDRWGVAVVAALGFQNTYALAMREERAAQLGVRQVGDLTRLAPSLEIGGDYEFFERPEWAALRSAYGLHFREKRSMDPALMVQALEAGAVDVISAFSSDGHIPALHLRLLRDDRGVIPPYDALILARPGLASEAPEVVAALRSLAGSIDLASMQQMNLAVDEGGRPPAEVARDFVQRLGRPQPPDTASRASGGGGVSASRSSR